MIIMTILEDSFFFMLFLINDSLLIFIKYKSNSLNVLRNSIHIVLINEFCKHTCAHLCPCLILNTLNFKLMAWYTRVEDMIWPSTTVSKLDRWLSSSVRCLRSLTLGDIFHCHFRFTNPIEDNGWIVNALVFGQ